MERLQKLLAAAGVSSRRGAEALIQAGRVSVNGEVVTLFGRQVDPEVDVVAVDGVPIVRPGGRTLLLHKPADCVTTRSDPHAHGTVMDLVPDIPGLHPVGRLDKDTTGLLLLTNDGDLTYVLTHPRHHVDKTYRAWVYGVPNEESLQRLRTGIELEDGMTSPAEACVLTRKGNTALVQLVIHEGRKRQIRRMLIAIGHRVFGLARVRVGPLTLGDLPEGQWRDLTSEEIAELKAAAGE
jgi:23S rRNA pseudouridine2605 synthase